MPPEADDRGVHRRLEEAEPGVSFFLGAKGKSYVLYHI